MFDFIIEIVADIAEIFVDLRVNKVINRKKKVILIWRTSFLESNLRLYVSGSSCQTQYLLSGKSDFFT